jgi:pimeloyl-ACP methyl ester carboxylesterase
VDIVVTREDGKPIAKGNVLKRPPVILVHGIWGSGKPKLKGKDNPNYTWKEFRSMLESKGYSSKDIIDVNYDKEIEGINLNATSFDDSRIKNILGIAIDEALDTIGASNLAGRKVDIVAHSMGGLVVRSFCEKEKDFCKESIRKLITIDTPHQGSELADLLVETNSTPQSRCYEVLPKIHKTGRGIWADDKRTTLAGAHQALSIGSPALSQLGNASFPVPLISVVGLTEIGFQPIRFAYDEGINDLWQGLWGYCGKVPDKSFFEWFGLLAPVFPDGGNDRIVGGLSQVGPATEVKDFSGVDHATILGSEKMVQWVVEQLDGVSRQP